MSCPKSSRFIGLLWLGVCATDAGAFLRAVDPEPTAASPGRAASVPTPEAAVSRPNGFVDPDGPGNAHLQSADEALRGLPRDADGRVDWVRALRDGHITPRADVRGEHDRTVLDKDVLLKNTRAMPWVRFPHRAHTEWLDCSNCHPDPFPAGQAPFTTRMESIFRGQACGKCHDRVAFVTHRNCYRCHSVPQPGGAGLPTP